MALYINDKNVIKLAQTDRGIKLIVDFIESFGEVVTVDRKMAYPDILIQTQVKTLTANGTIGLSNTVGISDNQIYVNPWGSGYIGDVSPIVQLHYFINNEMISIIRDDKLREIGI